MCLSPQSARLRSDLHGGDKNLLSRHPLHSFPPSTLSHSLSLSLRFYIRRLFLPFLVGHTHSAYAECERGERKNWLSETRRAVLCILQWQRYYVKRPRAHTHVTKFLARSKKTVTDCSRQFVRLFFSNTFFLEQDGFLNRELFSFFDCALEVRSRAWI